MTILKILLTNKKEYYYVKLILHLIIFNYISCSNNSKVTIEINIGNNKSTIYYFYLFNINIRSMTNYKNMLI